MIVDHRRGSAERVSGVGSRVCAITLSVDSLHVDEYEQQDSGDQDDVVGYLGDGESAQKGIIRINLV